MDSNTNDNVNYTCCAGLRECIHQLKGNATMPQGEGLDHDNIRRARRKAPTGIELARNHREPNTLDTPEHAAQNRLHRRIHAHGMLVRIASEKRRMHIADLPARMRERNRVHAVDFDQINLGAAQAHDNRHGHHARTVDGEYVTIGKATAVGSIEARSRLTTTLVGLDEVLLRRLTDAAHADLV